MFVEHGPYWIIRSLPACSANAPQIDPPAFAVWRPPQRLEPLLDIGRCELARVRNGPKRGFPMISSLALSWRQTQSPGNFDIRFWLLLALPIAGLVVAVLSISGDSGGGVSSAILEVTGSGI